MKVLLELLVVDDNPADVALVCEALAGSPMRTAATGVRSRRWITAAFADWTPPARTGKKRACVDTW